MAQLLRTAALVECSLKIEDRSDHRLVHLAGRLTEAQVPDLFQACGDSVLVVRLHLGDLISVDAVGLEALHSLRQGGAALLDVPTYIQLKLNAFSAKKTSRSR